MQEFGDDTRPANPIPDQPFGNDTRPGTTTRVQPRLNPLTQDDLILLRKIITDAQAHRDLIERCRECGLDMDEKIKRNDMHRDVASKIIEKFFPPTLAPTV